MVIFFPIFHFGWINASLGLIFLNFEIFKFKKGPPDAVKNIFSISSMLVFLISWSIEKCSESMGTILVLFFFAFSFIKFHPQIIDSLLAMRIFFVLPMIFIVGFRPAIPGIAEITISDLIFLSLKLKKLIIFTLLFLNFFFTLLKIYKSFIT